MKNLRKKIGDAANIETVRGIGYKDYEGVRVFCICLYFDISKKKGSTRRYSQIVTRDT